LQVSEHPTNQDNVIVRTAERVGRGTLEFIEEIGHGAMVVFQSIFWLFAGPRYGQPVRFGAIVVQMVESGIHALPILMILNGAIGVMLAIQGIYTLKIFGAESQVTFGIAVAVVREFAPLITGILIAGRTGSALAAKIGTMRINQELDALHVMGINPIRYLAAPSIFGMILIIPAVTFFSGAVSLFTAALYVEATLGISVSSFFDQVIDVLSVGDLLHGLTKSLLFSLLIAIIGVVNGASVTGGADGVGKATTRSVVQAISAIVITDMVFAYIATLS
jgi:phospholipid/cholesterol/gamma-HCH transport system permease protein